MATGERRDLPLLRQQGHRQANPRHRGPRHKRARGRRPTEGDEEAEGAAAWGAAVAVDHLQGGALLGVVHRAADRCGVVRWVER